MATRRTWVTALTSRYDKSAILLSYRTAVTFCPIVNLLELSSGDNRNTRREDSSLSGRGTFRSEITPREKLILINESNQEDLDEGGCRRKCSAHANVL